MTCGRSRSTPRATARRRRSSPGRSTTRSRRSRSPTPEPSCGGPSRCRPAPSPAAGSRSVAIQRAAANSSTFTTICTDASSPYGCDWATTGVADGLYDLRAVMTYASGQTLTSALVEDRRVDNSAVTGYDVQAENRSGGTAGRLETGDALVLTWSRTMNVATLLAGWSGSGPANMVVRLVDGDVSGIGTGGGADGLQLLDAAGNATGLGSRQPQGEPASSPRRRPPSRRPPPRAPCRSAASTARSCASRSAPSRAAAANVRTVERDADHGLDAERDRPRSARRRLLGRADQRARNRRS